MVYENKQISDLIEKAKKEGSVSTKEILSIVDEDSEEYEELMSIFDNENIEVKDDFNEDEDEVEEETVMVDPDDLDLGDVFEGFIGDIENDPNFVEFTSDIENEVKNKDIEDLVGPNTQVSSVGGCLW